MIAATRTVKMSFGQSGLVLGLALFCAFGGALNLACQTPNANLGANAANSAVPVRSAFAVRRDVTQVIHAIGTAKAYRSVEVVAQVTGQIASVEFQPGQEVRAGDLLFRLDDRPLRAAVREAKARMQRNAALVKQAQSDVRRTETLVEPGLAAPEELERAYTTQASAQAGVQADASTLRAAELTLDYAGIRAPIDGRTGPLLVHAGNVVRPGDHQTLVTILQTKPLTVRFGIAASDLARLRHAMADGEVEVRVQSRDDVRHVEAGKLRVIDNAILSESAMVMVEAVMSNESQAFWPGQAVDVDVRVGVLAGATVIPEAGIVYGQEGPFVFVVGADEKVKVSAVKLGQRDGSDIVIESGVEPGERVIIDGHLRLVNGSAVQESQVSIAAAAKSDKNVAESSTASSLSREKPNDAHPRPAREEMAAKGAKP
jgi:multidrug efflux system membrane fusion protein